MMERKPIPRRKPKHSGLRWRYGQVSRRPGAAARALGLPAAMGRAVVLFAAGLWLMLAADGARASTYVVYVALDDPVYQELDTLNGLGLLDDYLSEVRPIARVEAARLVLEAEENLDDAQQPNPLAQSLIKSMRAEFREEVEWLERNHEDNPPTMFHPLEKVEAQYVYSSGTRRHFPLFSGNPDEFQGQEGTPLLPNNDDLPTSVGSNEVLRISNWGGLAGFLTGYAETSVAGPFTRDPVGINNSTTNRLRLLRGEVVASLGNQALSVGYQEMSWGTGYFAPLSQGNNGRTFPALRFQNVHPQVLPGFLRYLGPFRHEVFIGRLDHGRYAVDPVSPAFISGFSYPWISGQIIAFKPLPTFEMGLDHVIMFGGTNNSNYGWTGWLGRATGLNTGSASSGNTNSRGGIFLKLYFPSLRNTQVYQEILGEDNLTAEARPIGGALPFLAVSYQGGVYVPRLTADGLTSARFEYAILEPNYSIHSDSLYWAYYSRLMADPMGPDATEIDLAIDRWIDYRYKASVDLFYTERAPRYHVAGISKERSGGFSIDLLQIPSRMDIPNFSALGWLKMRVACEYVHDINWNRGTTSLRTVLLISGSLTPTWASWIWH
jgi:Capsule assembly protein Wzi